MQIFILVEQNETIPKEKTQNEALTFKMKRKAFINLSIVIAIIIFISIS